MTILGVGKLYMDDLEVIYTNRVVIMVHNIV